MDISVAQNMVMPEGDTAVILQFNKTSGAFVTWLQDSDGLGNPIDLSTLGGQDLFVYIKTTMNVTNDVIQGTYPDYTIVDSTTLPEKAYERLLDSAARDKITSQYPVIQQVNILGAAIVKLLEAANLEHEPLNEMLDYIAEVKAANAARKEFFQQSPDYEYISIEQEAKDNSARLDGGVHELYGARVSTGGSVFGE